MLKTARIVRTSLDFTNKSYNISKHGMLFNTEVESYIMEKMTLKLKLVGKSIKVKGVICRTGIHHEGMPSLALFFTELSDAAKEVILTYLKSKKELRNG